MGLQILLPAVLPFLGAFQKGLFENEVKLGHHIPYNFFLLLTLGPFPDIHFRMDQLGNPGQLKKKNPHLEGDSNMAMEQQASILVTAMQCRVICLFL